VADISVTPASVARVSGGIYNGTAGATITAGQVVYLDAATGLLKLADANVTIAEATVKGIALHGSLTNQPLAIQTDGVIAIGATVVLGGLYILSVNAGGIAPFADIAPASFVSLLGIANTTAQLTLGIVNSGIQHA
jgi:hypothetical protein